MNNYKVIFDMVNGLNIEMIKEEMELNNFDVESIDWVEIGKEMWYSGKYSEKERDFMYGICKGVMGDE